MDKQKVKRQERDYLKNNKFIKNFIKDIKANGIAFIKSASIAKEISEDPSIELEWDPNDLSYRATYVPEKEIE